MTRGAPGSEPGASHSLNGRRGEPEPGLAVRGDQLELEVVRVAEEQGVEVEPVDRLEVRNLSMRDTPLVEEPHGSFQLVAARDADR